MDVTRNTNAPHPGSHILHVEPSVKPVSSHPLLNINLFPTEDSVNPRIVKITEAALRVAAAVHESQGRNKDDVFIPYLNHVVMAHDILYASGERDPVILAATLCHDSVEDFSCGGDLSAKKGLVRRMLEVELEKEGFHNAESLANQIAELTWRVTNDETMNEGKTIYQIDRLDEMVPPAIRIKMADHAASILEDTIHPPNWDARRHARKMSDWWSMAASEAAQQDGTKTLSNLVLNLCDLNWDIKQERKHIHALPDATQQQQAQDALQKRVDGLTLDALIEKAAHRERPILASEGNNLAWLAHPMEDTKPLGGVLAFGVTATDQVAAFRVMVEPSDQKENHTNQLVQNLLEKVLEAQEGRPNHAIIKRYVTRDDGISYREIHLEHPVPAKDFLRLASTLEATDGKKSSRLTTQRTDHALLNAYAERFGLTLGPDGTPLSGYTRGR